MEVEGGGDDGGVAVVEGPNPIGAVEEAVDPTVVAAEVEEHILDQRKQGQREALLLEVCYPRPSHMNMTFANGQRMEIL